jgi:hypothetical protein
MNLQLLLICLILRLVASLTLTPRRTSLLLLSSSASSSSLDTVTPDRQLVYQGMVAFRQGNIPESIAKFDASVSPGSKTYLWQRGISYYYNDQFSLGSQQFRDDVLRSPLDVEEIVWDIACLLRMDRSKFPPPDMMSLPPGKTDRRPIMVCSSTMEMGEESLHDLSLVVLVGVVVYRCCC